MRVADLTWAQVEAYLGTSDLCALPFGCTEQHAYLSLATAPFRPPQIDRLELDARTHQRLACRSHALLDQRVGVEAPNQSSTEDEHGAHEEVGSLRSLARRMLHA